MSQSPSADAASPVPFRVLITAGPTHEPIDAVRYIANRSSGRMGLSLAQAAARRGWPTTLLLGPTPIQPPQSSFLTTVRFQTTADLQALLAEHWPRHDVLFMAAAVADYTPVHDDSAAAQAGGKLRRENREILLRLRPTPDLLAGLSTLTRPDQTVVGFALEPVDRLMTSAQEKLARKRLDAIVANPLETMDSPTVTATVLFRDGPPAAAKPNLAKADFAEWLLDLTQSRFPRLRRL
jgi:phosphopantothenoylcysteine decarboxylase / phosphopantothenate---cysteine ligase